MALLAGSAGPLTVEGLHAVYVGGDGVERRVPWVRLPEAVAELRVPVRSFPSYRGQRNFPGWYWSATAGLRRFAFFRTVELLGSCCE